MVNLPLQAVAPDFPQQRLLIILVVVDQQTFARRRKIEVYMIANAHAQDNQRALQYHTEKQIGEIRPEQLQRGVVRDVDVHDL